MRFGASSSKRSLDFVRALKTGQCFSELRTDLHDLRDGCDEESHEKDVCEETA